MNCFLCPRKCGAVRTEYEGFGACKCGTLPKIARAAVHLWEEPCISGTRGSGTVFFSGCSLQCVFCQNFDISSGGFGKVITVDRLKEIYAELQSKGVHNINLVNPTHFTAAISASLDTKPQIPVIYNTGGYDSTEQLKTLEGKVDVYLPDLKFLSPDLARKYCKAPDYPEVAKKAILEMIRQTGPCRFDENGIIKSGVIIRHLIMPDNLENTYDVIDFVASLPPHTVLFSLMGQYTPNGHTVFPELSKKLTEAEYRACEDYMHLAGITDGFVQSIESADAAYTPPFDLTGV